MEITKALLTPNNWSRSQKPMLDVRAIAIHFYLKAGQSARNAVAHWERRKHGRLGYGSGHYALDDRETLLVVPTDERAYHLGAETYTEFTNRYLDSDPNAHVIGIELAHADVTGKPSTIVWENTVELCADLCDQLHVPVNMIVTHFDITGMRPQWNGIPCHRWFVEQPGELARLQAEVRERKR